MQSKRIWTKLWAHVEVQREILRVESSRATAVRHPFGRSALVTMKRYVLAILHLALNSTRDDCTTLYSYNTNTNTG